MQLRHKQLQSRLHQFRGGKSGKPLSRHAGLVQMVADTLFRYSDKMTHMKRLLAAMALPVFAFSTSAGQIERDNRTSNGLRLT